MSYGIVFMEPFDSSRHDEADKKWIASIGQDLATNQIHWYLKKVSSHQKLMRYPGTNCV
jgi:hypothetical protein